jgi:hypothetical protein
MLVIVTINISSTDVTIAVVISGTSTVLAIATWPPEAKASNEMTLYAGSLVSEKEVSV